MSPPLRPGRAFVDRAGAALAGLALAAPRLDEAWVLVLDGAPWHRYLSSAAALLDRRERARARRFRFDADRSAYVVAHAFWRVALASCVGVDAAGLVIGRSPQGRPLLSTPGLSTSLSHAGCWVAIALAGAPTVGVDVERWPSATPLEGLVEAIATPAERAWLARLPIDQQARATLALWTRKEALLKSLGTGLQLDPAHVETTLPVAGPDPALPPCQASPLELSEPLLGSWAGPVGIRLVAVHRLPAPPGRG